MAIRKVPARSTPPKPPAAPRVRARPVLPSAEIPSPPAPAPITVGGIYADTVALIPRTQGSLHLSTGRVKDGDGFRKVLVPFFEMMLDGKMLEEKADGGEAADDNDFSTILSTTVPIENAAFVLLDLTNDLRRACAEIAAIAQGDLAVEPSRMAHVRYFVAHLEREARLCRRILDRVYGEPEPDKAETPSA